MLSRAFLPVILISNAWLHFKDLYCNGLYVCSVKENELNRSRFDLSSIEDIQPAVSGYFYLISVSVLVSLLPLVTQFADMELRVERRPVCC